MEHQHVYSKRAAELKTSTIEDALSIPSHAKRRLRYAQKRQVHDAPGGGGVLGHEPHMLPKPPTYPEYNKQPECTVRRPLSTTTTTIQITTEKPGHVRWHGADVRNSPSQA